MGKGRHLIFEQFLREARDGLKVVSYDECKRELEDKISFRKQPPQILADLPSRWFGTLRWMEAIELASEGNEEAWWRLHLRWRYDAFRWKVYLDHATSLAEEYPDRAKKRRLGIANISANFLNSILMTMAFSGAIGEVEAAEWFGHRCVKMISGQELIINRDACQIGSVEPFLIELFCRWKHCDFDVTEDEKVGFGPFQRLLDSWNKEAEFRDAVWELCELHERKARTYTQANNDMIFGLNGGPYKEFPAEILFLSKVRRDLGFPELTLDHPIVDTPMTKFPQPIPRSGKDEAIEIVLDELRETMPDLHIPWEDKFVSETA